MHAHHLLLTGQNLSTDVQAFESMPVQKERQQLGIAFRLLRSESFISDHPD